MGGILAGAVIKYAGAVMKGFALILGELELCTDFCIQLFTCQQMLGLMLTGFVECYGSGKQLGWPDV